jgi:hypothetical protein
VLSVAELAAVAVVEAAVPGETPAKAAAKPVSRSDAKAGRRADEARILGFLRKLRAGGDLSRRLNPVYFPGPLVRPELHRGLDEASAAGEKPV